MGIVGCLVWVFWFVGVIDGGWGVWLFVDYLSCGCLSLLGLCRALLVLLGLFTLVGVADCAWVHGLFGGYELLVWATCCGYGLFACGVV